MSSEKGMVVKIWFSFEGADDPEDCMVIKELDSPPRITDTVVLCDPKSEHSEWVVSDVRWIFTRNGSGPFCGVFVFLDRIEVPHEP